MPDAYHYIEGPEFGFHIYCTRTSWSPYLLPLTGKVRKLRNTMETLHILIRQHHNEETIGKPAFVVWYTLMLVWTMVCCTPFKNPKHIINIPYRHLTIEPVTFTKSSGAGQSYIHLVDSSYKSLGQNHWSCLHAGTNNGYNEAFWPMLAVDFAYLCSPYCLPHHHGSGYIFIERIMVITFQCCWHWPTELGNDEDGYFLVCHGFPMKDWTNISTLEGQVYDVWSDQGCIEVHSSDVGLSQTLSLEHLDSKR